MHGGVHFHSADRSTEPRPRQLPGDVRGFVDRLAELARLDEILADDGTEPPVAGVLIIAGTAGVGKTSLALHWAHTVRHRFPDGQFYVNLRGYDPGQPVTPEQVLDRFLRALGVPGAAISSDLETQAAMYRSLLADRRILVVLDNAATVGQVRPLLPGTAGCLVVVTSRSRLSGLVAREGARRLTLEVPLTSETEHLADAAFLARMADDAILVNAARGPVVDTAALTAELSTGRLRAIVDVTEPEPLPADHPLWTMDGLLLTPHVGGSCRGSEIRSWRVAAAEFARYARGERPTNLVNGEY